MSRFSAVAWDIDGTLADSEGLHLRALVETCRALGVDLSDLPEQAFSGVHMLDVWTSLRPRLPARVERREWLAAVEHYYIAHAGELVAMPEAVETVRELAALGVAQACVSNSGRAVVDANIAALGVGKCLAFSISLDDVVAGKPDPEPYRLAAHRLGALPRAVVAVEDSATGARSAREAGLFVARYAPAGDRAGETDVWVGRLSEVRGLFKGR
jgi:HAD superfamily hydrolase (TIGR01509 family)